jgi:TetR/AcrR family transcriptional repressor of mexCD-oprJ operon
MAAEAADHRRATAERNVQSILDAAEALLHEGQAASIAAVAARAGVSRVTVYAHFSTREAILEAVLERAVSRATVAFDEATSGATSAVEALERAIRASWVELSRHAAIAEAAAAQLSPDALRKTHESGYAHARRMFEAGMARGEFRTDVPSDWLVSVYHALLHAAGDDVRAGRLDDATALHALTTTMRAAFAPLGSADSDAHAPAPGFDALSDQSARLTTHEGRRP